MDLVASYSSMFAQLPMQAIGWTEGRGGRSPHMRGERRGRNYNTVRTVSKACLSLSISFFLATFFSLSFLHARTTRMESEQRGERYRRLPSDWRWRKERRKEGVSMHSTHIFLLFLVPHILLCCTVHTCDPRTGMCVPYMHI